jgi:hypothetical protein
MAIYQDFMQTGMGQSIAKASRHKSAAHFTASDLLVDSFSNYHYHPHWKGDSLFLSESFQDDVHRTEQVDYIIGSGHHTNSHLWEENGYLHQMPFTFYTQEGKLDLPPGYEGGHNSRFSRKIGLECLSCHNAYPHLVEGSENKYEKIPEGIDCERCHGPGEEHVRRKMAGELIDTATQIDYSIVNPAKLPLEQQFQICMRCHLQGNTVLAEGKSFYDFKPGMQLSEVLTVFVPEYENDDSFIMASHVDRLKQSDCFQQAELSCLSCHDPHHSVRKTEKSHFNNKCASCHDHCTEEQEERNDCISCHMPKSSSSDIPHVSITDHKIGVHQVDSLKDKGVFKGLRPVNNPSPDRLTRAKAYLYQYEKFDQQDFFLDSAQSFLNKLPKERAFSSQIHLYFLKEDYRSLITYLRTVDKPFQHLNKSSYDNVDAWTAYRIGQALQAGGEQEEALSYYLHAVKLAPFVLGFRKKLASLYMQQQELEKALAEYQWLIDEFPKDEEVWCNKGFAHLQLGDLRTAESCYDTALQLNPLHIQSLMNKAALANIKGEKSEVIVYLEKVLRLNPNHQQAIYIRATLD